MASLSDMPTISELVNVPGAAASVSQRSLLETARRIGDHRGLWDQEVEFDLARRHYARLYRDHLVEVWLICWDYGQDTLLHDHGGSSGAFAVIDGELLEDFGSVTGGKLTTRRHRAGGGAFFGPRYLHNLVAANAVPAVSIHVYSPPLTSMNFYCLVRDGLYHLRRIPTESPEPDTADLVDEAADRYASA
ncbi:cysteine dioxygenase family protein [Amycolatopsis sp. TNS106]|uniref:cysteine dioxygenase n=1 Tax=Amycolatopsis sp. TNS106 TaxID=2861750 RepID=UPI001C56A78B|nr:cysteine dioxygenase family protein [Amycolatopsis sp. TNS106]QXV56943.1 cysteine dioxygenase [Amycolatopsis sp. TNS106]